MLVRYWMSRPAVAIDADAAAQVASDLMGRHGIRFLPVMDDRILAGVITDQDLKKSQATDTLKLKPMEPLDLMGALRARDIMSSSPVTIDPELTMEEAAEILLVNKISGLPVTDKSGKLLGVITQSDVFRVIIALTGVGKQGVQFAFRVLDRPGCIRELTDTIRSFGGRLSSILSSYERAPQGYRRLFIRAYGMDRPSLDRLIEVLAQQATLLYLVDHGEKRREIYG